MEHSVIPPCVVTLVLLFQTCGSQNYPSRDEKPYKFPLHNDVVSAVAGEAQDKGRSYSLVFGFCRHLGICSTPETTLTCSHLLHAAPHHSSSRSVRVCPCSGGRPREQLGVPGHNVRVSSTSRTASFPSHSAQTSAVIRREVRKIRRKALSKHTMFLRETCSSLGSRGLASWTLAPTEKFYQTPTASVTQFVVSAATSAPRLSLTM